MSQSLKWLTLLTAMFVLGTPNAVQAQGLSGYKKQKLKKRKRVTSQSCQKDYIAQCKKKTCNTNNAVSCEQTCKAKAPTFCKNRSKRRTRKQVEVAAKAGSVLAGGVLVMGAKAVEDKFGKKVVREPDPYDIYWSELSVISAVGGGYLFGGVFQGAFTTRLKKSWYGLGGQVNYLKDSKTDLYEAEVGPTFSFAAPGFGLSFGLQPSLLVTGASDADNLYGFGVRSYTEFHTRRLIVAFNPMLGYINQQWAYHLSLGATFRITPRIFAKVAYDYRDILDLNDLDISQASLQGVVGFIGFRFN